MRQEWLARYFQQCLWYFLGYRPEPRRSPACQDRHPQAQAAQTCPQQRLPHRPGLAGPQQEQENQWQPDGAFEHVRPAHAGHESCQRKADTCNQGGETAQAKLANQGKHEACAEEMREDEKFVIQLRRKRAIAME